MDSSPPSSIPQEPPAFTSDDVTWNAHSVTVPELGDDGEDLELETDFPISDYREQLIARLDDGGYLVGYLSPDEDCQSPLESCSGMGEIISCQHGHRSNDDGKVFGELAMDCYGNADWNLPFAGDANHCFLDEADVRLKLKDRGTIQQLVERDNLTLRLWSEARAAGRIGNPHAVILSYYEHTLCEWRVATDRDQFLADSPDGVWIPGANMEGWVTEEAERRLGAAELLGVVRIERRTLRGGTIHSTYVLSDGRTVVRREREGAPSPGLPLLAENRAKLLRAKELEVAREYAAQACTEYTAWCNGDCWGRCVERFDADGVRQPDGDEHVWGFVGDDAEEVLRAEFESHRLYYNKEYAETRTDPETVCTPP